MSSQQSPLLHQALDPWQRILGLLEGRLDSHIFSTWFGETQLQHTDGARMVVRAPNLTVSHWLDTRYRESVTTAARDLALPYETIEFVTDAPSRAVAAAGAGTTADADTRIAPARAVVSAPGATETAAPAPPDNSVSAPLNPKHTFGSFVVGSSNQFAHAAAIRVAADPGRSYNPLFLYGGAGLGKTHLMQAIGHELRTRYTTWRVVYLSAEQFMNEMIHSLKTDKMVSFKERFRNVDALLVDDVQFLSGKESMQEEFFHTFNTLYGRQAQLVLSSDRPPKEILDVEERLRSRFEQGLMADIQPPDLETRQAILMKKAEAEHFLLPAKVALYIASAIKSNIRELEGSLTRLMAYASLTGGEVTEPMARQILHDVVQNENKRVSIETIQKAVCEHFNMRLSEMKAKDNSKRVVRPRQVAMWVARKVTNASLPQLAKEFGDKHHTTVLHSINKIDKLRLTDRELNKTLNKILSQFE